MVYDSLVVVILYFFVTVSFGCFIALYVHFLSLNTCFYVSCFTSFNISCLIKHEILSHLVERLWLMCLFGNLSVASSVIKSSADRCVSYLLHSALTFLYRSMIRNKTGLPSGSRPKTEN